MGRRREGEERRWGGGERGKRRDGEEERGESNASPFATSNPSSSHHH